ncbi:hypothetical protein [Mucilaginibacter lacusdianchii]|uniref:hypothetical protein n=1 Tax=Mucilaginibacter lacusdianchii TaxID=2684211 RepID=UPI00131AF54A|nr:hypothetical protein [Mucilaginibacter sp. JXJ CY 39]
MKKSFMFLIVYILVLGCKHRSAFEQILIQKGDSRYWKKGYIDSTGKFKFYKQNFEFYDDGSFKLYYSEFENNKGSKWVPTDGHFNLTWKYNERDSILRTSGIILKVLSANKDTILMKATDSQERFFFISAVSRGKGIDDD